MQGILNKDTKSLLHLSRTKDNFLCSHEIFALATEFNNLILILIQKRFSERKGFLNV